MDIENLAAGCLFLIVGTAFIVKRNPHSIKGSVIQILGGAFLAAGVYLILFSGVNVESGRQYLRAVFN